MRCGHQNSNVFLTVSNVIMTDVVQEEPSHPSKQRPVNSSQGTTEKRPLCLSIMWNRRIRVVDESEHNDPVKSVVNASVAAEDI